MAVCTLIASFILAVISFIGYDNRRNSRAIYVSIGSFLITFFGSIACLILVDFVSAIILFVSACLCAFAIYCDYCFSKMK